MYSNTFICGLIFFNVSGITQILTHSRNYTELREAWVKWRDVSGKLMKQDYEQFVNISNKAVQQLGMSNSV